MLGGETPSLAGRRLGHFELIEAIGAGGMAAVLKALDLELGRIVALKILPPESALDPENVSRFKQEARAAAKLDHENIARAYFCGEDQGLHFIAFEFVEGTTLRGLIDRRGRLSASECVGYMVQIAAGLAHAAERGVVHRDIKPSNIIITPSGRAKIVDMGLARLDSVNGGMTQSGVTLGTFDYISPEQALDPRRADVRSDIYSLGCTFYHALTGRPPVPEGTAAKKLHAHQHVPPLDPRELNPDIPDALAVILARMMAKDPDYRYQSPAELIGDLKQLGEPLLASTDFSLSDSVIRALPARGSIRPPGSRMPVGILLAGVALVVAVGALALTSSGDQLPQPPWAKTTTAKKTGLGTSPNDNSQAALKGHLSTENIAAASVDELQKVKSNGKSLHIRLTGKQYNLATTSGVLLLGEPGRTLTLEGAAEGTPPVEVRLAAVSLDPAAPDRPGTLTFVGYDSVRVQGVRFVTVSSPEPAEEGLAAAAGLAAVDVGQLSFTDCQFDSPSDELKAAGIAVVGVNRTRENFTPHVRAERCLLLPGAVGFRLCPRVELSIEDSGFAPQTVAVAQIHSEETPTAGAEPARIAVSRSSFMLDARSAVVQTDGQTAATITAGYCVFAPAPSTNAPKPSDPVTPMSRGVVVRVDGELPDGIEFHNEDGWRNLYYHVDPLGLRTGEGGRTYTFEECADQKWPITDRGAAMLPHMPWAAAVAWSGDAADLHAAFRLRLDDPGMFVSEPVKVVGARFTSGGKPDLVYRNVPLVPPVAVRDIREKIWWPFATEEQAAAIGAHKDLVKLLRDVKSGDTILIRYDGVLEFEPINIRPRRGADEKSSEFALTFKPFEEKGRKCRPILTAGSTDRVDDALFTVEDGEVAFENLEFRIAVGNQRGISSRAVASIVGGKRCQFRSCVVTLDGEGGKAAAVVLADLDGRMMGQATKPVPQIQFVDSLVRGRGHLLWVPTSRAFELDVSDSVAALEGATFIIEPTARPTGDAHSRVKLKRLTALLGGPLLELQAGRALEGVGHGLVPTQVDAEECLFAAVPGSNRPFVETDGIEPTVLDNVLTWSRLRTGVKANWYANFESSAKVVEFDLMAEGMPSKAWTWTEWLHFGDRPTGRPVGKVAFARGPATLRDLGAVVPKDAAVKSIDFPEMPGGKIGDTGAETERLPRVE